MPLKCSFKDCSQFDLAEFSQIAFYQDLTTNGWNLALGPEYVIPGATVPTNICLVDTGDNRFPYNVVCANCTTKVGIVNLISGFELMTANFSSKKVYLVDSKNASSSLKNKSKWSKLINVFPNIRRICATISENAPLVAVDTTHFHSVSDLDDIICAGKAVSLKSNLSPKDYQWRGFCFSCFNNVLLCLPTGMGKTLIANMLMKAYHRRNANKMQVFIVPTVVLVQQQASAIEQNTDMRVVRRSGDEFKRNTWSPQEICVCTPAMFLNAMKLNQIAMSQLSLLILDEVHEANNPNSPYGLILPYITQCPASKRPRVLGITASPCSNSSDMHEGISSLCTKLTAVPYTPLRKDSIEKPNSITCSYVSIEKTSFEMEYEKFVIESLDRLSHLHNFFKANWKTFPAQLPAQTKIDTISAIISHSRLFGRHDADIQLLQLTTWMLKWLDSLNILQIFGPKKLIQLIHADLDYAEKNQALSKISPQLGPIIDQLRQSVEKIFTEQKIDENSPKLTELLSLLKRHCNEHERILIFVERRATAERLCRRLKEDVCINEMNPISVMGNRNGGAACKDMQQNVLEMFRSGECRILVATSVLEQGIDVAMCGLVICFDGVKSVKSVIQSRGRARKDNAIFVAFVTAEKRRRANELTQMEVTMDYTVHQLMQENINDFDQRIGEELEKFLVSDDRRAEDYSVIEESDDDDNEDDQNLKDRKTIRLRFLHFVNSSDLVDHINRSVVDRVKITRKYVDAYFTVFEDENTSRLIKDISTVACDSPHLRSWIEVFDDSHGYNENKFQRETVTFDSLTGFFFEDFTTVSFDTNFIWTNAIELHILNNEMEISTNNRHFHLHATNVEAILINDTTNSFEIYLCLRNPPAYFIDKELAHFDFMTRSFNLCLQRKDPVDGSTSWKLRQIFQSFTTNIYHVCHLRKSNLKDNDSRNFVQLADKDFMTTYLINVWHSAHSALLPAILPKRILQQFYKCSSLTALKLLLNNTTPVRFQKFEIKNITDVQLPFMNYVERSDDYASLCRVNVTPTRFIYLPMQSVQKNRVLRYYPDPTNFLLISFTDENGGNPWRSTYIFDWFLSVLRNGIKIGEKTFTFLGCSNSQLREGRCWFSSLNRDDVYNKIGEFPDTWGAGRKLTRIALAFASSFETVALNHERYLHTVANDVEVNGVNFSDGIGRASHNLMAQLQTILNLPQKTSAFQIRIGGIKGVISVFHQDDDVTFRKSMKKFNSKHNMLEVLNYSRSLPLYLNRHVILLLSNFGIADDIFLEIQHKMLVNCVDALVDEKSSLSLVKSRSQIFDWELIPPEHLVRESFFNQILISNTIDLISGITNHSHIPVSKGRILMGVLDETGTLEYGQIYAHIVESDCDLEVEGRVLIFRNPCVLPSDIRVLSAIKSSTTSGLKDLYTNCLVLPSKGPNSHASECSGGDLDGDLYYVIWDENLVPQDLQIPGEKVVEVKTVESEKLHLYNDHESMMQFYCDYVSKNQLGIIANAHLAVADQFNMRHPKSIELAKYVTAETDAPKKGYTVGRIPSKLLPSQYPDFMQKSDKPSYRSETILGELYRQSKPILEVFLEKRALTIRHLKFNVTTDESSIENCYSAYCYEIKTLLQSFDLASEVDLFSGTPIWKNEYLSTYKQQHQLRQNVLANVEIFWRKWKRIFDKWRSANCNNQQKNVEWYSRPKSSPWPINSFSFLAMPHVNFDECIRKSITQEILDSTRRWVLYNKMRWLNEWRMRYNIVETVMNKLNGIECDLYGSSALGLNEEHSDIDLCASSSNFRSISEALTQLDHNVEIIKKPHACVALTYETIKIEVTNFSGGVRKTNTLAKMFDEHPGLWAALRVLIEWARIARIVKSCGSEGLMTVISFCHLFIYIATESSLQIQDEKTPYTLKRFGSWIDSLSDSTCGILIYDFLKKLSSRDSRLLLTTKMDPLTNEPLIKKDLIDEICKNAEVAICILSVHNGDVQKLFEFCTKKRLFRLDKRYVDPVTSTDTTRNLCLKELSTVCNPKKYTNLNFQLTERNGIYYVEVSGDHKSFPDVEKGINKIHCKILNTRVQAITGKTAYHVKNATIIIPEFGCGTSSEISFSSYEGERYHVVHTGLWKSKIKLRNVDHNLNWRESEYRRYESRFLKQMELYAEKERMARKTSRCLRFFGKMCCRIRCGNHYFFHIPESLHNTFETITLLNIEEKVAHMEESLDLERQDNIVQDMKNYNSLTLIQSHPKTDDTESLLLMPLHDLKQKKRPQHKNENLQFETTSNSNNLNGIRHSFYTNWSVALNDTRDFAAKNGFNETPADSNDYYTNITVFWRQRELTVSCDNVGRVTEIGHRKVRWLSATFNKFEEGNDGDIRIYLESRTPLDNDESESCLKTVIEYLNQRSVFTEAFAKQLETRTTDNEESFPSKPLIPDIFHFNWRFSSMRVITPVLKFVNDEKDECILNEIHDGIFHVNKREFEWFPKHFEFELRLHMDGISTEKVCRKSYDFGLKMFDLSKLSCRQ